MKTPQHFDSFTTTLANNLFTFLLLLCYFSPSFPFLSKFTRKKAVVIGLMMGQLRWEHSSKSQTIL